MNERVPAKPKRFANLGGDGPKSPEKSKHLCAVEGCDRPWALNDTPSVNHGYCRFHYYLKKGKLHEMRKQDAAYERKFSYEGERNAWLEKHRGTTWEAMYQAASAVEDADVSEFISLLKKAIPKIGKLPYNPATIEPERDAYGQ